MDIQIVLILIGALFLAWTLGANDASNCFGLAVSEKIVSYLLGVCLCSGFLILGAFLQGSAGIETYNALSYSNNVINEFNMALGIAFASALCVFIANSLKLSASVSQVVVGAILGTSIVNHVFNFKPLLKIVLCWALVPIIAVLISFIVYYIMFNIFKRLKVGILDHDIIIKYLLIIIGCYASYSLGANNVANIVGVIPSSILTDFSLTTKQVAFVAGVAISLGVITYSKKIMLVVGKGVLKIDGFGAVVAMLSSAITLHVFAIIGVPVSSSHSIIGALLGVGLIRGGTEVKYKKISSLCISWCVTPIMSMLISMFFYISLNSMLFIKFL